MKVFYFNQCFQNEISTFELLHTKNTQLIPLLDKKINKTYFISLNDNEFIKYLGNEFKYIYAAGGLVYNPDNEILLMYRRGYWDLPKGKIDDGETAKQGALREVTEETGLQELQIIAPLTNTYHLYKQNDDWMFKTTYWFTMKLLKNEPLIPQIEEDIEELKWVPLSKVEDYKEKMHNSLKSIFDTTSI